MRKLLNTYFGISRSEYNGLLILIVLIAGIAAIPKMYEITLPATDAMNDGRLKMLRIPADGGVRNNYANRARKASNKIKQELFVFDPNTIGAEEWQRLGLSVRQSAAIINYRQKGGKFRKGEDLQRMYTISDEMYKQLLPYVNIDLKPRGAVFDVKRNYVAKPENSPAIHVIEVNHSDSAALVEINGIGPAFASRIIRYRERIGGFYRKEQLMEVFGLDSLKFSEIRNQVSLDTTNLRKINVNAALVGDFKNHPYIRYKQANALVQYRKQHGNYRDIADLSKVLILDAETINRLAPYLIF